MNFPEKNNNDIDLIEKYLDGELTLEEQQSFNKRMNDDPEFKKLTGARKEIHELWLKARNFDAVKEEVRRIHQEGSDREKNLLRIAPGLFSQRISYAIAASVLLLAGILSVFLIINKASRPTTIAGNDKNKMYQVQKQKVQPDKGKMEIYNRGSSKIVLIKPDEGAVLSEQKDILFQWKYTDDSVTHFTILKGSDNSLAFTKIISSPDSTFLMPAGTLNPGVYTWSIRDQKIKRSFKVR
jgi:hypothetical protein